MELYEHHVTGRDPMYVVFTVFCLFAIAGAVFFQAPWWILLIWGFCTFALLWNYYSNPKAGMSLSNDEWRYYAKDTNSTVPFDKIEMVRIATDSEGPDEVTLLLKGGDSICLPRLSFPNHRKLIPQLERRNLVVERL